MRIVVGTRGSALARTQTQWVVEALKKQRGDLEVEVSIITSSGDRDRKTPLSAGGSVGLFTRELEGALCDRAIDLAVHSMKDLPTEGDASLVVAAVPQRASPCDALVTKTGSDLASLGSGARVGTGSPRRQAQILALREDLVILPLRGNIDTRVRKLEAGDYDAIVAARAALDRMGIACCAVDLSVNDFLPAPAQGALAIQTRRDDGELSALVASLDHAATHACVTAERELLVGLGGGCAVPLGALGIAVAGDRIELEAAMLSTDGKKKLAASGSDTTARCAELGRKLAAELSEAGARAL